VGWGVRVIKYDVPVITEGFDEGHEQFKIGVVLKQAREEAGLTQEELARRLHAKKTAISRIENHAEDIKLSTPARVASAPGKQLEVKIAENYSKNPRHRGRSWR